MAKKKNELDELKKRQNAVLSGNGLGAVKAADSGLTPQKTNSIQQSQGRAQQAKQAAANEKIRAARQQTAPKVATSAVTKPKANAIQQSQGRVQQAKQEAANRHINARRAAQRPIQTRSADQPAVQVKPVQSAAEKTALERFGREWQEARTRGDQKGMDAAHAKAEALRGLRGYSGGADGSKYIRTGTPASGSEVGVRAAFAALGLDESAYNARAIPEVDKALKRQSDLDKALGVLGLVGRNTMAGVSQFNAGLAKTADLILPDVITPKAVQNALDWYKQDAERTAEETARENYAKGGKAGQLVGQLYQGTIASAPQAIIAMMTGGTSEAQAAVDAMQRAGVSANVISAVQEAVKNPGYWASFAQTIGSDYEEAKAAGASEGEALTTAFTASLINAGIEIGGGVEQMAKNTGRIGLRDVAKSAFEEGLEEVEQGITSGVVNKAVYDKDRAWASTSDQNAILNPARMAQEFAGGAVAGGILSGGGAIMSNIGRGADAQTGVRTEQETAQMPETQTIGRDSDLSTTSIDTNPTTHTPEQLQGIRTYVAAVDRKLKTFFEKYRDDPNAAFSRMTIAPVSERQAADVSNLLGGDFSGYVNAIDRNGVNHILKRHGENGNQDHSMADLNDAARIGYVLQNYDSVKRVLTGDGSQEYSYGYVGKENKASPLVKFEKKINGTYYVVEAVPDSNYKKMWVVSAYIEKNSRNSYASGIDAETPTATPEAPLPSPVSAENIIAQSGENINRNQGENEAQPQEETKNTANQEMVEKPEAKGGKAGYLYRNIVSGQAEIEKFAGAQKRANRSAVNAEDLAQMSRSVGGTVDAIAGNALVDRKGDKIGKSWKETVGKPSKEESERLNLYRQHLHNIDRMSLQAKAGEKLAEVRQQIADFKAQHTGIDQHTEAELMEFEHNYDLSPAVRESAKEYLALLQKEKDLAAVRNKPVLAKKNGKGEMIPYTAEESRAEVKAMLEEHPELAEQAKAAEAFHDQFIREWAIGSGLMSEEQYNAIHEKYPHYVQSFRVDHMKTDSDGVTRKGGVNTSNPIRKAVGDITEIVPFEDAEMMQVNSIVRMARRNELFRNIYEFAKANKKASAPYVRVLSTETDTNANTDTDIETVTETLEQGAMQATGDGYILTAMVDGKPVKMEVNADFYAGLQNLYGQDRGAVNDFLAGTIGKATTAFKQVTTGYNPWFPITNFAKDIQTGYINTISDAPTFINYVGEIGGAMIDMKRGSDDWKAFRALGGRDSGYYHNEKGFTASDRATRVESIKDVPHAAWEKTKELLSFVGENGEAIMRFAEYKAGVKKYGNTQEGRAKAIQAAADVTVNFSRSAPAAKTAENFVPYLNASIQGLDKMYRQVKEHPVKTTRRNLEMLTVSTLLLWMVNKDDEDYENLNNRTKDNYFCIPVGRIAEGLGVDDNLREIGIETEGKFLKIPKSREWGAVFSALMERYLRTIVKPKDTSDDSVKGIISRLIGRDEAESTDKAYRGIGTQLLTNVMPSNPATDNIFKTVFIDLPNNKDFAGRDIVPQRLQGLSPENQYDYTTSDVGKTVANAWNTGVNAVNNIPGVELPKLAPVQADYLIDSNLGFVGDLLLAAGSDKSALSYFGDTFAQKFTADPKYQNGATDYFYELLGEAETAKNDANLAEGITSRMKTPEEFYHSELNSYANEISELRKQEREILSGNMSKQEQERRVREIRQKIIEIANEAPGKAQEALEAYKKTYIPEISHLSDEKQEAARKAHDELGLAYNDFVRFTDDYAEYVKETMGQEKDTAADVAEMLRGYKNLTDEQRDVLYQVYSDNMEKNPFHVSKYEAEMDQTTGLYAEMTEAGRMRIRALLNDYEQDINDGKAEAGKLDGWKAKAYMAEQEAGITPAMYSQYRIALEIANTDGNTNYSQGEAERAVRMLNGLSNEQMAYLFASTNSQWKKNPFGSASVSKYETGMTETEEKSGADEYLVGGSSLLGALTAPTSATEKKNKANSKTRSKPKKLKNLDNLKVLKPLKNLF